MNREILKGTVKSWSINHGYGLIKGEDGKSYFVQHSSPDSDPKFRDHRLTPEVEITFTIEDMPDGYKKISLTDPASVDSLIVRLTLD